MKITFILPAIDMSGGTKAVFEFANHLLERGNDVYVVYPLVKMSSRIRWFDVKEMASKAKGTVANLKKGVFVDWFDVKAKLIRAPFLGEKYIPNADIIVATWWGTAYYVNKYSREKGEKFYLVQHYETCMGPEKKVDGSYKLGLRMIVNSSWLKKILENKLQVKTEDLILHAPDRNEFYPEGKNEKDKETIRILMPYRLDNWKGSKDGIKVFEIVKKKFPNVKLIMFGPEYDKFVPPYAEFHKKPTSDKLREIYNLADIFLFPSWHEGFGMPPMEAMACKIPVVTTRVGGVPDYTVPGITALVSEPRDIESLAGNIIKLIENEEERKKIGEEGYNYTKNITWEKATEKIEADFKKALNLK